LVYEQQFVGYFNQVLFMFGP